LVIFGWEKLTGFQGTVGYFGEIGVPMPALATLIAVVMEFFVGLALILGVLTRPLAIVLAVYTFGDRTTRLSFLDDIRDGPS
jgi:putative oxidoreductase